MWVPFSVTSYKHAITTMTSRHHDVNKRLVINVDKSMPVASCLYLGASLCGVKFPEFSLAIAVRRRHARAQVRPDASVTSLER